MPVATLPFTRATAVTFGGKHRDILFCLVASIQLDVYTVQVSGITPTGSTLFAIKNLGIGRKYKRTRMLK